jgi:uncharacterized protein YecE (DUF72 family)
MDQIRVGTSAFTADGWAGTFYPAGLPDKDRLTFYATKFDTVEIDSTYYATPSESTVRGWAAKVPDGFVFAAKVWSAITHDKALLDCRVELTHFVKTMDLLGNKLGPMLLQLPYYNQKVFKSGDEFLARLKKFLPLLSKNHRFALEIRNPKWMDGRLADLLREYGVALVLQDQSWMPRPTELFAKFDPITADFTYARLVGDRKGIEKLTKSWDKVIVDRSQELFEWHEILTTVKKRGVEEYVYINNHYSGHGPATAQQFLKLWNPK